MKNVTMIAAIGRKRELGKQGDLIWEFKQDLKFFKEQTMGKPIVMGYNTFFSLRGGKPLPGRQHIILTSREETIEQNPQITFVRSLDELLQYISDYGEEVMIIGGAMLYETMMPYADKLILTEIESDDKDADVFFPEFDKDEWNSTLLGIHQEDGTVYSQKVYTKKVITKRS